MDSTNCSICGAKAEQIATTIDGVSVNCPTCEHHALAHESPVVDAVVARTELAMPPAVTVEVAKGFSLNMVNAIMTGRADEIIDLTNTNLWR
jgi:DNA-directed RNA polymerase subunit RPC12/RpoP